LSNDSPLVTFTDSNGADLDVADWGHQSFRQGLAVFGDYDDSELIMDFLVPCNSLSLWFGNDDPGWSNPGDQAVLKLFYGATLVGQTSVVMNRDDIMNQQIGLSGPIFNKATFKYDVNPQLGLIEIVDNIEFTPAQAPIPEAGSLALFGVGLCGLVGYTRRRRK
jgi:hypothetical protein